MSNHLAKLEVRNFQGFNRTVELAPITILSGLPDSGKTTLLAAMHWLLAGYIPGVSKKPGELFEDIATGSELYVSGWTYRGTRMERKSIKSGDAVKTAARLDSEKHEGSFVPTVLLDSREFLTLSDRERVKMLFNFVTIDEKSFNLDGITAAVRGISVPTPTADSEAAIRSVCEEITKTFNGRGEATLQEWLSGLVPMLKERKKKSNAGADQAKAMINADAAGAAPRPISPTIDRDLAKAREHCQKLNGELQTLREQMREADRKLSRKVELETHLTGKTVNHTAEIQRLNQEAEKARAEVMAYKPKAIKAAAALEELKREKTRLEATKESLEAQCTGRTKDAEALVARGSCPTCGADDCKELAKRAKKLSEDANRPEREKIQTIIADLKPLREKIKTAEATLKEAQASDRKIDEARTAAFEAQRKSEALSNEQNAFNQMQAEFKGIGTIPNVETLKGDAEKIGSDLNLANEKVATLEVEQRAAIAARSLKAQREQMAATLARHEAAWEVEKLAEIVIETKLSELIDQTVAPVVERANTFASRVMKSPLVYHKGEFGRWNGQHFARHNRFSGTTKAATYAALSLALVPKSDLRVVWIDEMGIMPTEYRKKLIQAAAELIRDGKLDQFIGVDWNPAPYKVEADYGYSPDVFKLIEL